MNHFIIIQTQDLQALQNLFPDCGATGCVQWNKDNGTYILNCTHSSAYQRF